jgi:hypothetical protein
LNFFVAFFFQEKKARQELAVRDHTIYPLQVHSTP